LIYILIERGLILMSEVEVVIDMPAEYSSMVFGQFDEYAKAIESNLNIELIARDEL
jgi:phosphate starvation-inducible protein PhoH and related proteins